MRRWKPQSGTGRWIALVLSLLALGGAGFAFVSLGSRISGDPARWQIDIGAFGLLLMFLLTLAAAGWCIYRFVAAMTLHYELDRNGMYITWAGNRTTIPLDRVNNIDAGAGPVFLPLGVLQRIGTYWGRAFAGETPLYLFATRHPDECLVIYTPGAAYAISPDDPDAFVQDLEQRRNLGATKTVQPAVEHSQVFHYAFWQSSTILTLVLATVLVNLLAFGIISARYPALAPLVEMRFDAIGEVAELRPRHQALFLPLAALGLSLLNMAAGLALYNRLPPGAQLLQGASVIVQILFLVAVASILY
ncbi:MAG: hypothetical protein HXY39_06995 [Chloroflexi bacterium]|nr:hypothetical protein [Chloroflexota bacterium]